MKFKYTKKYQNGGAIIDFIKTFPQLHYLYDKLRIHCVFKLLFEYTIIQAEKFVQNKAVPKMIEEFEKTKAMVK